VAQVTLFDASLFKNFEAAHLARLFLTGAGISLAPGRPCGTGHVIDHGRNQGHYRLDRPLDRKNELKDSATMSSAETSSITVDFLSRFTASEQFDKVFREGMGLVEETANYLDGPGRQDARLLDRHGAVAYATESMRLTTRLMQLASWLLLQRAVGAGEMKQDDVLKERHRISLADIGRGNPLTGAEQLPAALLDIVERSLSLHQRILKFDAMIGLQPAEPSEAPSPVMSQIDRIAAVFSTGRM
jgi:regulator of CtrA degradation